MEALATSGGVRSATAISTSSPARRAANSVRLGIGPSWSSSSPAANPDSAGPPPQPIARKAAPRPTAEVGLRNHQTIGARHRFGIGVMRTAPLTCTEPATHGAWKGEMGPSFPACRRSPHRERRSDSAASALQLDLPPDPDRGQRAYDEVHIRR